MSFDAEKYTKSEWLHGADLQDGQATRATIKAAYEHTFERDNQTKPVITFFELEEKLALNKSQTRELIGLFGGNAGGWINQVIELMPVPSNFAGKPSIAIRRAAPEQAPTVSYQGTQGSEQPPAQAQHSTEVSFQTA